MSVKDNAVLKILKATIRLPAQFTLYTSALLAIATVAQADIPSILLPLATTVGVNSLSGILDRISKGDEKITESDIQSVVEEAIRSSNIKKLLLDSQKQIALGKIIRRQNHVLIASNNNELELLQRLTAQYRKHEALFGEIQEQLVDISDTVSEINNRVKNLDSLNPKHGVVVRPEHILFSTHHKVIKNRVKITNPSSTPLFSICIKCKFISSHINSNDINFSISNSSRQLEHSIGDFMVGGELIRYDVKQDNLSKIYLVLAELDPQETLTLDVQIKPNILAQKSIKLELTYTGHLAEPQNTIIQQDGSLAMPFMFFDNE